MSERFVFVTPSYNPVGGVVTMFDYLNHALAIGFTEVQVVCRFPVGEHEPLFAMDRFRSLLTNEHVSFHLEVPSQLEPGDLSMFSWPTDYHTLEAALGPESSTDQIIHIVQNVRHANPQFAEGYGVRILGRRMSRVSITHEVTEACRPFLNPNSMTDTIVEGHAWEYFSLTRASGLPNPIKVGYTTWKSSVGDEVARILRDDPRFEFEAIRSTAVWSELRELYHGCDAFLGCPGPEEGFYLPGIEAFAAGCILIVPDVGGNMAYSRFEDNCLPVDFEDAEGYVAQLQSLAEELPTEIDRMRSAAYETLSLHTLEKEQEGFAQVVSKLRGQI